MSASSNSKRNSVPPYTCSVSFSATVDFKAEWCEPFKKACQRSWTRVNIRVEGTRLAVIRKTIGCTHEHFYTLQAAEIGRATDYLKRAFTLRVRAEGSQFLLAASGLSKGLALYEAISAGIAISLPLDDRAEPLLPHPRRFECLGLRNGERRAHDTGCSCCSSTAIWTDENYDPKQMLSNSTHALARDTNDSPESIRPRTLESNVHSRTELLKSFASLNQLRYDSKVRNGRFVVRGEWHDAPEKPLQPLPATSRWRTKIPF